MKSIFLYIIWPLIFLSNTANGGGIKLSEVNDYMYFSQDLFDCYIDTSNKLSIDEFLKNKYKLNVKNSGYNKVLGASYWLEYSFINDTKDQHAWILELVDPHIGEVDFYDLTNDVKIIQGYNKSFNSKYYQHKNHTFDLKVAPGDSLTIYIRTNGKGYYGFGTKLQTYRNFTNYSLKEYYFLGAFYGLLFIMALYNFVLFIFTKNRIRLYYSFYVLGCSLVSFSEDCIGFQFIWPDFPFINKILGPIGPIMYLAMFILYTQSFLGVKKHVLKNAAIYTSVFFGVFYLSSHLYDWFPRYWVSIFLIPLVITLLHEVIVFKSGQRGVRFVLIGTSLIVISFVILQLRSYGILTSTFYQVYFFNFSVIIEVILFSMAIGEKMREKNSEHLHGQQLVIDTLRKNELLRKQVNIELEEKIKERTADLEAAKEKLARQAQEISEMNLRLDSDNRLLSKEMTIMSKKRVLGVEVDPNEFKKLYPDKVSCYSFLAEQKWANGFICKKCGNNTFGKGTSLRSRRCSKCGANETPTARTIFHGLRIPIESAFYLLALIVNSKGELSSMALSEKTGVNQKACWNFKQKVKVRMEDGSYNKKGWVGLIFDH